MFVVIAVGCPECRTITETCHHRAYPCRYLSLVAGTASVSSRILDNAMMFDTYAAAMDALAPLDCKRWEIKEQSTATPDAPNRKGD